MIDKQIKNHRIWMALSNTIDVVQKAQVAHIKIPYPQMHPHVRQHEVVSEWLSKMQEIRNNFS